MEISDDLKKHISGLEKAIKRYQANIDFAMENKAEFEGRINKAGWREKYLGGRLFGDRDLARDYEGRFGTIVDFCNTIAKNQEKFISADMMIKDLIMLYLENRDPIYQSLIVAHNKTAWPLEEADRFQRLISKATDDVINIQDDHESKDSLEHVVGPVNESAKYFFRTEVDMYNGCINGFNERISELTAGSGFYLEKIWADEGMAAEYARMIASDPMDGLNLLFMKVANVQKEICGHREKLDEYVDRHVQMVRDECQVKDVESEGMEMVH